MLSYKRQLSRAQSEADRLRAERTVYHVRVSRVEQAWSTFVAEAKLRLRAASTPEGAEDAAADPLEDGGLDVEQVAAHGLSEEDLDAALSRRSAATEALLARLQSLPSSGAPPPAPADLEARCAQLVSESLSAREHLRILRAEHTETLERLEQAHAQLVRAERRFDRMQSRSVAALEGRPDPTSMMGVAVAKEGTPGVGGPDPRGSATPHAARGAAGRDSPFGSGANGVPGAETSVALGAPSAFPVSAQAEEAAEKARQETEELRELVERRAKELEELRTERVAFKLEIDTLKGKVGLALFLLASPASLLTLTRFACLLAGRLAG